MLQYFIRYITVVCLLLLASDFASARDLVAAASSAQTLVTRIGMAAVGIGITIGGILFAMGFAHIGRYVIFSGLIGAAAIFGTPALVSALRSILG